jgi:hypothetical protein
MQKVVTIPEHANKIYRYVYCRGVRNVPFEAKRTAIVSWTVNFVLAVVVK